MARITLDLLRKRCEHNENLVHSLEELALHQDNLEEIENVDKWCRNLKILYLQSNSIQKIENLNRLKNLEYLNLALNGIERVENLEGCESLRKLDLTANFVGDLTSVESLRANPYLEELFLTGNPCADFDGYRSYVIASLPHLRVLDGQEVTRTEQLHALHRLLEIKSKIIQQQVAYKAKRDTEKQANFAKISLARGDCTDPDWENLTWSPEYRREMHRHRADDHDRAKSRSQLLSPKDEKKRALVLCSPTGEIMNVNEARLEYVLKEEDENNEMVLDVAVYRHLDSSLLDVDVNPFHVKVTVKGKILQLRLEQEVMPDRSSVQRSRTSGRLVIRMPLAKEGTAITCTGRVQYSARRQETAVRSSADHRTSGTEKLEVDPSLKSSLELNFAKTGGYRRSGASDTAIGKSSAPQLGRPDSPDFIDNPDVPALI